MWLTQVARMPQVVAQVVAQVVEQVVEQVPLLMQMQMAAMAMAMQAAQPPQARHSLSVAAWPVGERERI